MMDRLHDPYAPAATLVDGVRPTPDSHGRAKSAALALAILIAALGWAALAYELDLSLTRSFALGRSWSEALFLFFRYFTIETNCGIAMLMTVTALRLARGRPLLPPLVYTAGLVYIAVTCVTYEVMLRREWIPNGLQYYSDMTIHDIVPVLTLGFFVLWLGFSTRRDTPWSDPLRILIYPLAYFAMTLLAGVLGEGYPYGFIDVGKRGYPAVLVTAAVFLGIFLGLGLALTAIVRVWPKVTGGRSPVV